MHSNSTVWRIEACTSSRGTEITGATNKTNDKIFQNNQLKYWHKQISQSENCSQKCWMKKKTEQKLTIDGKHDSLWNRRRNTITRCVWERKRKTRIKWNYGSHLCAMWKEKMQKCMAKIFGFNQIIPMQRKAPFICRFACRSIIVDPLIVKTARQVNTAADCTAVKKNEEKQETNEQMRNYLIIIVMKVAEKNRKKLYEKWATINA